MQSNKVIPEEGKANEEQKEDERQESDTSKPKDPEVDTDEGDMVKDEYVNNLKYYKGSMEEAKQYREDSLVRDVDNKYYNICRVSIFQLGKFGVGIHLYFKYLKFMAIAFAISSILALPCFITNIIGEYYKDRNESVLDFTTLGNQYGFEDETTNADSVDINDRNEPERAVYLTSDLVNTVAFFIFLLISKIYG